MSQLSRLTQWDIESLLEGAKQLFFEGEKSSKGDTHEGLATPHYSIRTKKSPNLAYFTCLGLATSPPRKNPKHLSYHCLYLSHLLFVNIATITQEIFTMMPCTFEVQHCNSNICRSCQHFTTPTELGFISTLGALRL